LNYRRGFLRVFILIAICWYLGAGIVLWPRWSQAIHARREANRVLIGEAEEDGTLTAFVDEFQPASQESDPFAKYGGAIALAPASAKDVRAKAPSSPKARDSFTGASLGDSLPEIKKKLSPMRFEAWRDADNKADNLRPIAATVGFVLTPMAVYAMAIALWWVIRGFRSQPTKT